MKVKICSNRKDDTKRPTFRVYSSNKPQLYQCNADQANREVNVLGT